MFKKYDAYKDSKNVELPIVPADWKVDRIKYEIKLLTGYPFNSAKYIENGIKLVRGINVKESVLDWKDTAYWSEVTPDLANYLLESGDILIGMDGSKVGKNFCQITKHDLPLLLLQRVARLRVNEQLNARFLFWNIASKRFLNWINRSKTDPMIPHMAPKDIKDFVIAFPPKEEQELIAKILDQITSQIDQAIAIKEQQIALLNERKQIVIQKAVTQGLDPNVVMKDSGVEWIGQIPEHWEISRIKHLGKILNGFAFPSDSFTDQGVRVLKISNIQTMTLDWQDESYIDEKWKKIATNALVYKGDLVFALTRPIISTGLKATIIDSDETMLLNQRNAVLRPNNKVIKEWLYYVLLADGFVQEFEKKIDITGQQPNISTVSIGNLPLVYPKRWSHLFEQLKAYL
ncbi:restriction endonuclease subunit S [Acinetobacter indicus]|uniref:restriction endonuclease subunit S n=1 Tax=Acinetobacter indicus TaxID=756892 RepID=UPI0013642668|nr:restriction endonuclease subunit S [Acinetobacter indicus]